MFLGPLEKLSMAEGSSTSSLFRYAHAYKYFIVGQNYLVFGFYCFSVGQDKCYIGKLGVTRSILNGFFSKVLFQRPFPNFLFTPEVDFQQQNFQCVITIKPEHLPFKFRNIVYQFLDYKQIAIFRQNRKQIFSDRNFD